MDFTLPFRSVRGHVIHVRGLRDPVVIDLGSNHGAFSLELGRLIGGTYRMYEANPDLVAGTKTRPGMSITHAAIAACDGTMVLNLAANDEGSSLLTLPETSPYDCVAVSETVVPTVSLNRVLRDVPGRVDLVKMDIEGGEVDALNAVDIAALTARVGQLTVEFHSAAAFGFDIADEVEAIIARIGAAGFEVLDFGADRMDVLFLNRALLGLTERRCRTYQRWATHGYPRLLSVCRLGREIDRRTGLLLRQEGFTRRER